MAHVGEVGARGVLYSLLPEIAVHTQRAAGPGESAPRDKGESMDGYAQPQALIESGHLEGRLEDAELAVVEVDEDTTA
jgi:hypothetical protein